MVKALNGEKNGGSLEGVRMNNEKFITIKHDPSVNTLWLAKVRGGACVQKTHLAIVIVIYNKTLK